MAKNQIFIKSNKRDIRADAFGTLQGTIAYDTPNGTGWTATFPNLVATDIAMAVAGESRGQWLGRVPAAGNENTIYEFPSALILPGPAVGCGTALPAGPTVPDMSPATDTGVSSTDNITSNPRPTFSGVTSVATSTSANLYVDGTLSATSQIGLGGTYSLTPTTALANGQHTITVGETGTLAPVTMSAGSLTVTIDNLAPSVSITSPAVGASVTSTSPTFGFAASEPGSGVTCSLDLAVAQPCTTSTSQTSVGLSTGVLHTFKVTATDVAGNTGLTATRNFTITAPALPPPPAPATGAPTVTGRSPAAGRINVPVLTNVTATFSRNVTGVSRTTFTLKTDKGVTVGARISYNATTRTATVNPTRTLAAFRLYTASLTSGIRDAAGIPIAATTWTFKTAR